MLLLLLLLLALLLQRYYFNVINIRQIKHGTLVYFLYTIIFNITDISYSCTQYLFSICISHQFRKIPQTSKNDKCSRNGWYCQHKFHRSSMARWGIR